MQTPNSKQAAISSKELRRYVVIKVEGRRSSIIFRMTGTRPMMFRPTPCYPYRCKEEIPKRGPALLLEASTMKMPLRLNSLLAA